MKDLYKKFIETLDSLPGIKVTGENLSNSFDEIKSRWNGSFIFFHSDEKDAEGLYFLIRCIDARYWEFGNLWRVELTCGDQTHSNGDRPITYNIYRPFVLEETEEEFDNEINSLMENMHNHFNNDSFMTGFNMNRTKYNLTEWKREVKLNKLGI